MPKKIEVLLAQYLTKRNNNQYWEKAVLYKCRIQQAFGTLGFIASVPRQNY